MAHAPLTAHLAHRAALAGAASSARTTTAAGTGRPVVLAERADATVVRSKDVVAKAHAPGSDLGRLALRVGTAAHPLLSRVLLAPLPAGASHAGPPAAETGPGRRFLDVLPDGRPVSLWPYGAPVDPGSPEAAPWEAVGTLLARLHAVPPTALPGPLPPGPAARPYPAAPPAWGAPHHGHHGRHKSFSRMLFSS